MNGGVVRLVFVVVGGVELVIVVVVDFEMVCNIVLCVFGFVF